MSLTRKSILAFSLFLGLLSIVFYAFSGLYYYLDERSEIHPVNKLASQGGDENMLIAVGFVIFACLAIFNLFRFKKPVAMPDSLVLFLALVLQSLALLMIEVASFSHSVQESRGWILALWFVVFGCLWFVFFTTLFPRKRF